VSETGALASPWYEDAVLEPDFPSAIAPVELEQPPQQIFLTNATGLLGSALLAELLQKTVAQIYCLVRAQDEFEGLQRIKQALQQDELWREEFAARIVPVCGDLGVPFFGLSQAAFESLSLELDCIYHNGAFLSHVLPYADHRMINVLGTRTVLKLACTGRVKPLHYISTLGILAHATTSPGASLLEVDVQEEDRATLSGGYDQSKWCAERILQLARERGAPITIYRPGRLTGHSQTGAWRTNDLLCRQIKGCIQLGGVPTEIFQDQLEMVPVDYVSQAIVAISRQSHTSGKVFHLLNRAMNVDVEHLVTWINDFGYPVAQLAYPAWRSALQQAIKEGADNVLAPFLAIYPEPDQTETEPQAVAARIIFDDRQTQEALAGTAISCPPIDQQLIHKYLSYFVKSCFLPAPPS
jgi:thioester reductase-like protein